MNKYIFLSDIDGTLINRKTDIQEKVIKAAHDYMNSGGLLGLSTGRSIISTKSIAEKLSVNMPCILYTGAAIYDFSTERYIWSCHFDSDIISIVEQVYNNYHEFSIQLYTHDNIFTLRKNQRLIKHGVKEEISDSISSLSDINGDILKLVLTCDDVEMLRDCRERFFTSDKYLFEFSSTHFVEVVPESAGKDKAMRSISQLYNIDLSNFFVAGDGMTDLKMLQLGGYPFVPSDATQELLDSCPDAIIIPPCELGGMEEAFTFARQLISDPKG